MPSGYDDKAKRMSQNKPKLRYLRTIINHLLAHAQQKSYPIHADCTESFSTEFAKIELAKERFTSPMKKCWKFDCCVTYFRGKLNCFLCNLTTDDKCDVSNLLFVFNTFFSNLCAMIKDTR